ncbi:MAG: SDR family oxidoreductase [Robiginitomaculum sp.]
MTTVSDKPLCLITGASAGIGYALAIEYARHGWDLALSARREVPMVNLAKKLKKDYGTQSIILPADLSDPAENIRLIERVAKKGRVIDGLINNAGFGQPGTYDAADWADHLVSLNLMLMGPCELTHRVIPGMKARGFGHIMNVASLAGHLPGSRGHTTYAAIKSFLIKFSQSLNLELSSYGVKVSALCPGFTLSEFHDVNGTRKGIDKLPDFMMMDAADVAQDGYAAIERGKAVFIPGGVNKSIAVLGKLIPDSAALYLMNRNSSKIRKG